MDDERRVPTEFTLGELRRLRRDAAARAERDPTPENRNDARKLTELVVVNQSTQGHLRRSHA